MNTTLKLRIILLVIPLILNIIVITVFLVITMPLFTLYLIVRLILANVINIINYIFNYVQYLIRKVFVRIINTIPNDFKLPNYVLWLYRKYLDIASYGCMDSMGDKPVFNFKWIDSSYADELM